VDDIEKILRVLVVRSKTEVIDVVTKESKKSLPAVSNYDDVLKTADAASHTLKKIGDVLGKHSRIIHVFAKKYAQDLKDHLELVTKNNIIITKMLSDYSSLESSSNMIKELAQKITESSRELQEIDHHIAKLQESKSTAESSYQATQKQLADIRSSPEHASYLQLQDKARQVKSQEEKLDKEIDDEFSKASRPLGKYVYVTSLDKSLKSILERLVERPSTVIMSESRDSIVTILESCMKGIVSGTVSVKETDKSVDHITSIISSLDAMISKKKNINAQIQDLEQQIAKFDYKKLESLEKQQAKSKSDVEDSESKIQVLQSELAQKTSQKQKLVSELESALERLGTKYQIILD
jgi:septal ring factor EnvC (AmiA/AmiB activator)